MIRIGLKGSASTKVTVENTAAAMGSGTLEVFATPAMIALMESAACDALKDALAAGESTVGTRLEVSHLAASPIGASAFAEAELIEIDRRKLVFHVTAMDGSCLIGEGRHERFLIDAEKFMAKTKARETKQN